MSYAYNSPERHSALRHDHRLYDASLPGRATAALQRISTIGYAMPGTVLAIGILVPVATLDRTALDWLGASTGLLLIGSGAALGYAYVTRFLAIAIGSVEAGFSRIPRSLDYSARSLGQNMFGTFRYLHLPLSKPSLAAAGLLIFVDCMKELPATLLLRPLHFETLATHLYGDAARGTYEEASIAALAIVLANFARHRACQDQAREILTRRIQPLIALR